MEYVCFLFYFWELTFSNTPKWGKINNFFVVKMGCSLFTLKQACLPAEHKRKVKLCQKCMAFNLNKNIFCFGWLILLLWFSWSTAIIRMVNIPSACKYHTGVSYIEKALHTQEIMCFYQQANKWCVQHFLNVRYI